jgi:hypothetical protein
MDKMHLVLSSDNVFILVSEDHEEGVVLTRFEG